MCVSVLAFAGCKTTKGNSGLASVNQVQNQPVRLTADDVNQLSSQFENPAFGGSVTTTAGTWTCVVGISEKVCSLKGSAVRISESDIGQFTAAMASASHGNTIVTNAGTWNCTTGIAGGKACFLMAAQDQSANTNDMQNEEASTGSAENNPPRLTSDDVDRLHSQFGSSAFGGSVATTAGTWSCTVGIVEKLCVLNAGVSSVRISATDMGKLFTAVHSASHGNTIATNSGTWNCVTGIASGKSCFFKAATPAAGN